MILQNILFFISLTGCLKTPQSISNLKKAFIQQSFNCFERLLNPDIYVLAEKYKCISIFDHLLGIHNYGILKKNKFGKLALDEKLTYLYNSGEVIKNNGIIAIMSPYAREINLENFSIYRFDQPFKSDGDKKIFNIFQAIYFKLKKEDISEYEDDIIKYTRENLKSGKLHQFSLETCDKVLETEDGNNHPINKDLEELKKQMMIWKLSYANFIDRTTQELLTIMKKYNIFIEEPNLREYPDLIPLVFPYKICNISTFNRHKNRQFTIGFDLRHIKKSSLDFLFNKEAVEKLLNENGVWYINFTIN